MSTAAASPLAAASPRTGSLAIILMGVSGSGKTAVGEVLAARLAVPLLEGDRFHPAANVAKMSSGTPLTDGDRWPWLDAIAAAIDAASGGCIVACSALRKVYRDRLRARSGRPLVFVFLDGSRETIAARLALRKDHFMPASLLDSQFATLEPPAADENAIRVSVEATVEAVAEAIVAALPKAGEPVPP